MLWVEAIAAELVRRAAFRQAEVAVPGGAPAPGPAALVSPWQVGSALRFALETCWLGLESLLAAASLSRRAGSPGPALATLVRAARRLRGAWAGPAEFQSDFLACRQALASARRRGLLTLPPDWVGARALLAWGPDGLEHDSEVSPPGLDLALEQLGEAVPGLQLVGKFKWGPDGKRLALTALAEALFDANLPEAEPDLGAGGALDSDDLAAVVALLSESPEQALLLVDAPADGGPVAHRASPTQPSANGTNGHSNHTSLATQAELPAPAHEAPESPQQALARLTREIEAGRASPGMFESRAELLAGVGQTEAALADFSRAIELGQGQHSAFLKRGDLYRSLKQFERAVADYTRAFEACPDSPRALARRASAFRLLGRLDDALRDLGEALALGPDFAEAYFELGLVLLARLGPQAALRAFDRAVELAPSCPEARFQRGRAREACGDPRGAVADLTAALEHSPRHTDALLARGRLLHQAGDLEAALRDLTGAAEGSPDPVPALEERARVLARLGRLDQALADHDAVLARLPLLAAGWVARGHVALDLGATAEAHENFSRAALLDPGLGEAYEGRARCAIDQGAFAEALPDLNEAVRLRPANARALHLRGTLHGQAGRFLEALCDLHQAALLDPALLPAYFGQRAQLHLARGEYALALADAAVESRLEPTNFAALQRQEQAREGLRRQQEASPDPGPPASTAPPEPRRYRKRRARPAQAPKAPPASETEAALSAADTTPALDLPAHAPEAPGVAATIDAAPLPAPEVAGDDHGLPAPELPAPPPPTLDAPPDAPAPGVAEPLPVGPFYARARRESHHAEIEERARRWDDVHLPPAPTRPLPTQPAPAPPPPAEADEEEGGWFRGWRRWAAILLACALLGGGAYGVVLLSADPSLQANDVWEQFNKAPKEAYARHKGQFVLVTGVVRLHADKGRATRAFFRPPGEKASWWIEVPLSPEDLKRVTDGATITVRGRFNSRQGPKDGLLMSNCQLVQVKGG